MIEKTRTELLRTLAELSAACPEMRFGQLIANLSTLAKGHSAEGLWDAEDEELLAAARQQLEYFVEHQSSALPGASVTHGIAAGETPSGVS